MSEHVRFARNRREFLNDCFCGMGSLAFASMMAGAGARGALQPARAETSAHARKAKAKAMIFVYMAGGPSHLETWDPKPLLNQLSGQKRPAEFGDVKYQNVNSESRISAASERSRSTASRESKSPTCFRTRPNGRRLASFAPCTATWWSTPPRNTR